MPKEEKNESEELKPEKDRRGLKPVYLLLGAIIAVIAGVIGFFVAVFFRGRRYF